MKASRAGLAVVSVALIISAVVTGLMVATSRAADERSTSVFDVDAFDRIDLRGAGHIDIQIGDESRVEITSPESVSRLFTVDVKDGELQAGFGASVAIDLILAGNVNYLIVTPSLSDLELTGPVNASLDGLAAPEFDLELSAAAKASLTNIDVADLEVDLDLASKATISGKASVQEIEADNASVYDGSQLQCASATVSLERASQATIRITDSLSGTVGTMSTLTYITEQGNVQVESSMGGSVSQAPFVPLAGAAATPVASPVPSTPQAATGPQTWEVTIAQFKFTPATLEIHVGDTVVWTNKDFFPHDVTQLPKGSGFASPPLNAGGTFTYTFDTPGTYDYFCALHPIMLGTVIVEE
ncbi:MAG: DUF2807 domain-containing protein [Thermomicrobiales bacterium]